MKFQNEIIIPGTACAMSSVPCDKVLAKLRCRTQLMSGLRNNDPGHRKTVDRRVQVEVVEDVMEEGGSRDNQDRE